MAFLPSLTREARETLLDMLEKGELTDLTVKRSNSETGHRIHAIVEVNRGGSEEATDNHEEDVNNDNFSDEGGINDASMTPRKASVQCICAECGKTFSSSSKFKYSVLFALSHHLDLHLLQD